MLWDEEDLPENDRVIETLETIMHEFSRLEDIENKKIQVAVEFVEEKRDKYWKDKIREKIKELEDIIAGIIEEEKDVEDYQCAEYYQIQALKELLEENNND